MTDSAVRRIPIPLRPAPSKDFEADDPFALVGVEYPVASDRAADEATARVFIEEYAMAGWSAERVRALFTSSQFSGPNGILNRRGAAFVDGLLGEVYGTGGDDG